MTEATTVSRFDSRGSVAEWRDRIGREFHLTDIAPQDETAPFWASLSKRALTAVDLVRMDEPAQFKSRTRSAVARDNCQDIILACLFSGQISLTQLGRTSHVHANDCVVMDCGHPFDAAVLSRAQYLSVILPRNVFERSLSSEDIACRRIDGASCWGSVLSAYLRALYIDFENGLPMSSQVVGEQILQLLDVTLGNATGRGSTHQRSLLRRARSIMRQVCHEEDIAPSTVANVMRVSKRYMHKVFAQEGTTFCRELDLMRIERAAGLLAAKNQRHLTINEIAIKCGLSSPAHFTRKFRSLKGMTPSQYREMSSH